MAQHQRVHPDVSDSEASSADSIAEAALRSLAAVTRVQKGGRVRGEDVPAVVLVALGLIF